MPIKLDRRTLYIIVGAAVAVLAGCLIAMALIGSHDEIADPAPPASQGGLVIDSSDAGGDGGLDPARPLRCFVAGQFVGELTLSDCAERNGVASGALDVGIDQTGALAASPEAGSILTPLPPEEGEAVPSPAQAPVVEAESYDYAPTGPCWRYVDNHWSRLPGDQTLAACVQTLFSGRCENRGRASYGRWMQQTLRLAPGRVEISGDNRSFRLLVEQTDDCAIPSL
ncbi:hypothetical protein [Phenylobacterium immobile]|uniref:hypothetical protein n=1 Tax=Phenylobacterium immobile TaxID=21 RepID=UPI000B0FAC35|nr:hypothetical protein [Phenylobacterium immobile]